MADQSKDSLGKESSNTSLLGRSHCVSASIFDEPPIPQANPLITLNRLVDFLSLCIAAILLLYVAGKWIAPFIITKILTPMLKREPTTLTRSTLALVLTTSLSLSPVFLVPSAPSMYLSGLFFGYKIGFTMIIIGTTIGIIFPFLIGRKFPKSINKLLTVWPDESAYVKLGKGSWFHQFRMVALCRLAPLNYSAVNYSVGANSIGFWPYICASVCVMIPEAYLYLFSANVMKICAELKSYWSQHESEALYFVVSAVWALGVYVCFLVCERRALKKIEEIKENEL